MKVSYRWIFGHGDLHKTCKKCLRLVLAGKEECDVQVRDEKGHFLPVCHSREFILEGKLSRRIRFRDIGKKVEEKDLERIVEI